MRNCWWNFQIESKTSKTKLKQETKTVSVPDKLQGSCNNSIEKRDSSHDTKTRIPRIRVERNLLIIWEQNRKNVTSGNEIRWDNISIRYNELFYKYPYRFVSFVSLWWNLKIFISISRRLSLGSLSFWLMKQVSRLVYFLIGFWWVLFAFVYGWIENLWY